ncbi:MAG: hypothetical protein CMJ83_11875 [Planctomycetes bacterium]|nr:hypothetical protein [Planctomycetota bacterium]
MWFLGAGLAIAGLAACSDDAAPEPAPVGSGSRYDASRTGSPAKKTLWPPFVILGRRPDPGEITWSFDASDAPVAEDSAEAALTDAFRTWQGAGVVRFVRAPEGAAADVHVSWHGPKHPRCGFLEWDGGVAHTAGILGGSNAVIHFRTDVTWSEDDPQGKSLTIAALHEIGHLIGLGHSPREDALMFGGYDATHLLPTAWDLAALHTVYGGGDDHPDDLLIVGFSNDGEPTQRAPTLRRVAPFSTEAALVDIDGDGSDELMLWQNGRLGSMIGFRFMAGCRVEKNVGPYVGMTRPDRTTFVGRDAAGRAVVAHVRPDGRYAATGFDAKGNPRLPRKRAPLRLRALGLEDADGDGHLEHSVATRPPIGDGRVVWARADVDGDGHEDILAGPPATESDAAAEAFQWLLTRGTKGGRFGGTVFAARAVLVGDLDGDGHPEGVVLGPHG